jgi:hypothetical protein
MEFKKNGFSLFLYKKNSESDEIFLKKGWFIISQPDILTNYDEIIRLSKIWINIKFKKCVYHKYIMDKLDNMDKHTTVSYPN